MRANRFITEEEFKGMQGKVRTAAQPGARASLAEGRGTFDSVASGPAGKPSSPYYPYVNKWEKSYSLVLEMEQRVGAIASWKYSGLTFTTAYRQYHRIDFIIGHNDRSIEIAQVKGYHPNMRAAIKGLKWAAQLYPMFTWTIKWWTGTGWDGKYVEI